MGQVQGGEASRVYKVQIKMVLYSQAVRLRRVLIRIRNCNKVVHVVLSVQSLLFR